MLNDEQKRRLLNVARQSLEATVRDRPAPDLATDDPALLENRGAFVTLRHGNELRGCLGYVEGIMPLIEAVAENAAAAARRDPRFSPVRPDELPHLTLEISALTPLAAVQDPADITAGQHGLMICLGPNRGLLLPQVATEYDWDRDQFLAHTCLKVGLPPDSWRDPSAQLYSFQAEVFGEKDLGSA